MTFSPELEEKLNKILKNYPPDRKRSAVIPMLLYAQDEIGSITRGLVEEVEDRFVGGKLRGADKFGDGRPRAHLLKDSTSSIVLEAGAFQDLV